MSSYDFIKCTNCDATNDSDAETCRGCGVQLAPVSDVPAPAPVRAEAPPSLSTDADVATESTAGDPVDNRIVPEPNPENPTRFVPYAWMTGPYAWMAGGCVNAPVSCVWYAAIMDALTTGTGGLWGFTATATARAAQTNTYGVTASVLGWMLHSHTAHFVSLAVWWKEFPGWETALIKFIKRAKTDIMIFFHAVYMFFKYCIACIVKRKVSKAHETTKRLTQPTQRPTQPTQRLTALAKKLQDLREMQSKPQVPDEHPFSDEDGKTFTSDESSGGDAAGQAVQEQGAPAGENPGSGVSDVIPVAGVIPKDQFKDQPTTQRASPPDAQPTTGSKRCGCCGCCGTVIRVCSSAFWRCASWPSGLTSGRRLRLPRESSADNHCSVQKCEQRL